MAEEKFNEMVTSAENAIENFNDLADDRAVSWAYDKIKDLTSQVEQFEYSSVLDTATIAGLREHISILQAEGGQ